MAIFEQGAFQQNQYDTPEGIKRRRQMIRDAMMNYGSASNVGEGIGQLLNGIATGVQMRGLDRAEQAGMASGQAAQSKILDAMMGGATSAPTPSYSPSQTVSQVTKAGGDPVAEVLAAGPSQAQAAADYLAYANQGATRNLPVSDQLKGALSFLPELGVRAEVFSGGQPAKGTSNKRVGSVRHDDGNAADVFFYKDGRKLDWANPQDLPLFQEIVRKGKERGLTGFGAGPGYMQPGSMHVGFGTPVVWGAGGNPNNAPQWLKEAYGGAPTRAAMPTFAQASASPTATQTSMNGAGSNDPRSGVAQALASGPTQVASLDPSAGLAYAVPQTQSGAAKVFNAIMPQNASQARGASGMDVWQGRANQGTATDGTQVTRLPTGEIQRTNRFGVTERMSPEGGSTQVASMAPQAAPMAAPTQAQAVQNTQQVAQIASQPASQPSNGVDLKFMMEQAKNPWVDEQTRKMALDFVQNEQMKQTPEYKRQQQLSDLQLEKERLTLEKLKNPKADTVVVNGNLVDRTTGKVIYSSPEGAQVGNTPASIQEYEYVSKLNPEQKQQYFAIKRAQQTVDLGTGYGVLDPANPGQVGSTITKDLAGAETQKVLGQKAGEQIAAAPSDFQAGQNALDLLDKIEKSENIDWGTGLSSLGNVIPGTPGFDFQNLVDQATSGGFLTAIQEMRGLGSLSNAEGQTATAAVNRMRTASSKDAFLSALNDYRTVIKQGMARAQTRLPQQGAAVPTQAAPQSAPTQAAPTPKKLKFNPATGELE